MFRYMKVTKDISSCICGQGLPELLFSSVCFNFSLQLIRYFLDGSDVALLLLNVEIYFIMYDQAIIL